MLLYIALARRGSESKYVDYTHNLSKTLPYPQFHPSAYGFPSKHQIRSQGIFDTFGHLFATVCQASLLEYEYATQFRVDVDIALWVIWTIWRKSCSASLEIIVISQVYLDCDERSSKVWKFKSTVTVTTKIISGAILEITEAFVKAVQKEMISCQWVRLGS